MSSGESVEGCTARRTSYRSIGLLESTRTTSYCFCNSSMIGQFWPGLIVWKLIVPYRGTSVPSTPTRFRFCCATVQSERTNSYSIGMPRSMNGTTTFSCGPDFIATPDENALRGPGPCSNDSTRRAVMPKSFSARLASSLNRSVSLICTRTLPPARA